MQIQDQTIVTITYELKVGDPDEELTLVESIDTDEAFSFVFGNSGLPEGFEDKLEGMKAGETFRFTLAPEEAYGFTTEEHIIDVPKSAFEIDGKIEEGVLQVGNFIPMTDDRGYQVQGKILEVNDNEVKMDFNHPLTGMTLHFDGKIENVRKATEKEAESGLVDED